MPGDPNGEHEVEECGGTCPVHRRESPALRPELHGERRTFARGLAELKRSLPPLREASRAQPEIGSGYGPAPLESVEAVTAPERKEPVHYIAGRHVYLSTHCLHGNCGTCNASQVPGSVITEWGVVEGERTKKPAQCKSCGARCVHSCHCHKVLVDPANRAQRGELEAYCGFHGRDSGWPCQVAWQLEDEVE